MEENEYKDEINMPMLLKLFKTFPLFFKYIIYFIENQKQVRQKSNEEKHYIQKINESFDSLKKKFNNLNELFDKLERAKINNISEEVNEITFENSNNSNNSHYENFYGSFNSIDNQTEEISYSKQKINFIKKFICCIKKIFEEFNDLLNSNKEIDYQFLNEESSIESENNIKFLEMINNIYKKNKNKLNNNKSKEKLLNSSIIEKSEETNVDDDTWIEVIKVNNLDELTTNIEKSESIDEIKINCENFRDLSIFIDVKLNSLKKLELRENKIRDITPFENCGFAELEFLDLEENELDNKSLDILLKLNLPRIIFLSLFKNRITTIKIFEILEKYKTLRTFYMGENKLNKKEIMNNKYNYYVDKNLDELGLTYIFNNETIEFIRHLNLENIKILYLNGNNLTSLSALKNIKFNRLDELWVKDNEISDINVIIDLPNKGLIKIINLTINKINEINNTFLDTLKLFPKLKSINIKSNHVNYKDCSIIIEKIKAIGINLLIDKN